MKNFNRRYACHAPQSLAMMLLFAGSALAQFRPQILPPGQLDALVERIALYPDPLLTEILVAATYPDQIPAAAQWANFHGYLRADQLARAISNDRLPWDSSVQSLLPFPSVLDMMSRDMAWTDRLGDAFLAQQQDVMESIQQLRKEAWDYGYLRSNPQISVVNNGPYIEIQPTNPGYIYVPLYDPRVVYVRPRGAYVGGSISFGPRISIGAGFAPLGWGSTHFTWQSHGVIVNNRTWDRRLDDRGDHGHPYAAPPISQPGLFEEKHERDRQYRNREQDNRNRQEDSGRRDGDRPR